MDTIQDSDQDTEQLFDITDVDEKIIALMQHLEIDDPNEITDEGDNHYSYYRDTYLVLTDEEADAALDEYLESYIDEVILPEIPEAYHYYFDDRKWKEDAKMDGRGTALSVYNGEENEENVNGTWYYIYRV